VLVPLDGSELAEKSLPYLRLLAPIEQLLVELVLVKESADDRASRDDLSAYLTKQAEGLWTSSGIRARPKVRDGIPYLAILDEAEDESVIMIVATTHGSTGPTKSRVGSVADKVLRGAPCPTLIIGPACPPAPQSLERILVPLDGSPLAEIALPVADLLAEKLGARIELIRVVESQLDATGPQEEELSFKRVEAIANSYLREAASKLLTTQADCVVRRGLPSDALLEEFRQHPTGIVVMSSHGGHGFLTYALGSVTDRVVPGPLPVLVIRPGGYKRLERLVHD